MRYSLAGIMKGSPGFLVLDIGITVSFSHQISDYIEMPIPLVKKGKGEKSVNDGRASITCFSHAIVHFTQQ